MSQPRLFQENLSLLIVLKWTPSTLIYCRVDRKCLHFVIQEYDYSNCGIMFLMVDPHTEIPSYYKGQTYSKFTCMHLFQAPELLDRVEYTKSVSWNF